MALDEIGRLQKDPDTAGWDDPFDVTLVRAADELHDDAGLTDATWQALAARYDDEELIETIMLVGYYHLVSFVLNSLGVPLEPGAESFLDG
jgi:alkylhydroperoxidase family enzyme